MLNRIFPSARSTQKQLVAAQIEIARLKAENAEFLDYVQKQKSKSLALLDENAILRTRLLKWERRRDPAGRFVCAE